MTRSEGWYVLGCVVGILSTRAADMLVAVNPLLPLRWLRRGWRRLRLWWRRWHFDIGGGIEEMIREMQADRTRKEWRAILNGERAAAEVVRLHRLRGGL